MFSKSILLSVLFFASAMAEEPQEPSASSSASGFILMIDQNSAGANELLRGEYEAAVKAAQRATRFEPRLPAYLTLCVAYIRSNQLGEASQACDRAVKSAHVPITTAANPYGHRNRDGLAKAYVNRAVLLSLQGDLAAARADFKIAQRQNRWSDTVRHNSRLSEGKVRMANSR